MSTSPATTEAPEMSADQMHRFAKVLRSNAERHAANVDRFMAQLLDVSHKASTADRERRRCEQEAADWEARAAQADPIAVNA